jgi:hypothetical protein
VHSTTWSKAGAWVGLGGGGGKIGATEVGRVREECVGGPFVLW